MASSGRGLVAGLAATDFCGCGAGFTAAGFTGTAFTETGLAAGLTEAAALGAALGATGFAAVALGIVLGAAAWAAVFAAGALLTAVLAGALADALLGVLAVVLAEFLVIMLLFLADVVLVGAFFAGMFLDCPTEALLPVAFLGGEPDFWALAASEWAFVAFTERAVAVRDVLAGPSVTFLALVFEFLALLLRVLADTGCTRNCHASVR